MQSNRGHFSQLYRCSRFGLAALVIAVSCGLLQGATPPSEGKRGSKRPKKIMAHYMGCYVPGTGAIHSHLRSGVKEMGYRGKEKGELRRDLGTWAATSYGSSYRDFGLAPFDRNKKLSLEVAADLEIRRAMRIGIDGFTFDAWAGGGNAKKLLDVMFDVCEKKGYDFELTITLDASCLPMKKGKGGGVMGAYVETIRWLLEKHGKSPNLARRDGKPLIMGYQSAWPWVQYLHGYVKIKDNKKRNAAVQRLRATPEGWKLVGEAYREMEKRIGQPIYWEFCMGAFLHGISQEGRKLLPPNAGVEAARIIARDLPAVGLFMWKKNTVKMAKAVVEEGAEWSEPIKLQYENYGSFQIASPGTDWIRGNWKRSREVPSTLMQYITWNDYHENTNLSPGFNKRYAYYDLTGYYISWWKTGKPPVPDHDKVYIFSHKYTHKSKIFPFKPKKRRDNVIEVLTILPTPATMRMPGRNVEWQAPAGLSVKQVPLTAGPVSVELLRDDKVVLTLESPEPVSERPFRQEAGKTAISTEFMRHWKEDFGDVPPLIYSEYGDVDKDGLPNWFEMLWFGRFYDMSTATVADPDADPDKDGRKNLQEYLEQKNPLKAD